MPFNVIPFIFQYSLFSKKESGHEDAIWSCAWGQKRAQIRRKLAKMMKTKMMKTKLKLVQILIILSRLW